MGMHLIRVIYSFSFTVLFLMLLGFIHEWLFIIGWWLLAWAGLSGIVFLSASRRFQYQVINGSYDLPGFYRTVGSAYRLYRSDS